MGWFKINSPNSAVFLTFSINFSLFSLNHSFVACVTSNLVESFLNSSSEYQGKQGILSTKKVSNIFATKHIGMQSNSFAFSTLLIFFFKSLCPNHFPFTSEHQINSIKIL